MSYLRHIHACNTPVTEPFLPWYLNGDLVGWLRPAFARHLAAYPKVFRMDAGAVHLHPGLTDFAVRSAALAIVAGELAARGVVPRLMDEPYPVTAGGRDQAQCMVDRAVAPFFGVRSFGQHLNGFVRRDGAILMWLGRRARDRLVFPGALDNMVAGGLPHGIALLDNLVKECHEEAGIPAQLARGAQAVGALSYNRVSERGFRPDVLYCYDLELPGDFAPCNTDGEVEEFLLLPLDEVARIVRETDEFKLNCNLVVIDFLIRHGRIGPDAPDYLDLVIGLRRPLGHGRGEPAATW